MFICSSARQADSSPPFLPFLIFQVATEKVLVPLPSDRDGASRGELVMAGAPRTETPKMPPLSPQTLPALHKGTGRTVNTSSFLVGEERDAI